MQSVLDSLCRCFGSTPLNQQDLVDIESLSLEQSTFTQENVVSMVKQVTPPTPPDMKRRTRSLALKDKQWDALFATPTGAGSEQPHMHTLATAAAAQASTTSTANLSARHSSKLITATLTSSRADVIEQAEAVAEAKIAAISKSPTPNHHSITSYKRKRSACGVKEDIFRTKKQGSHRHSHHPCQYTEGMDVGGFRRNSVAGSSPCGIDMKPGASSRLSHFLSSHPVIAQTLCFATPVTDSADEPDEIPLETTSVVSGNTMNTAEDTITSTLYYENTKLAGLIQKNPPMPLFNNFQVDERDDIHRIVATHSHSSARMKMMREGGRCWPSSDVVSQLDGTTDNNLHVDPRIGTARVDSGTSAAVHIPRRNLPRDPRSHGIREPTAPARTVNRDRGPIGHGVEDGVPPMTQMSSSDSSRSNHS